jgi:hypothetical protein
MTLQMAAQDKTSGQKGAMSITSDLWLAPDVPGYEEVRDFQRRFAEKMGMDLASMGASSAAMQRSMMKGLGDLAKEASKLKGVPILTVTRMGASQDGQPLPSPSDAPLPASATGGASGASPNADAAVAKAANQSANNAASDATSKTTNAATSKMGGFGNVLPTGQLSGMAGKLFGKKKTTDQTQAQATPAAQAAAQPAAANPAQAQALAGVLMETQSTMSGFSTDSVDASQMGIPAGYKQVQPDLGKSAK